MKKNEPVASIKIEKGIPIPPIVNKIDLYPWPQMEIGDSILVGVFYIINCRSSAYNYMKTHKGWRTTFRRLDDLTWRVWRTK